MKHWQEACISQNHTLHEVLEKIDRAGMQIALVVDNQKRLIGVVSDGDIRRGLIRGLKISDRIASVVNYDPKSAKAGSSRASVIALMKLHGIRQMPIVDKYGVVVDIEISSDYINPTSKENWVVVMAGGLGRRLGNLTKEMPKPLLQVGTRPILETIIFSFAKHGFVNFYISVNYKAEKIMEYFGNGEKFDVNIRYLKEEKRLGTAGALSLLPKIPEQPFFVTNADLIHTIDLENMLNHHYRQNADATMGTRRQEFEIPYGVVEERGGKLYSIEEKPSYNFTISAGVYVLCPKVLQLIPDNSFYDMPKLFSKMINAKMMVSSYKVEGYWLDIGKPTDYERAKLDFDE